MDVGSRAAALFHQWMRACREDDSGVSGSDIANGEPLTQDGQTRLLEALARATRTMHARFGRIDVPAHCRRIGQRVQQGWRDLAHTHGLPVVVDDGYPALAHFTFEHETADALGTLFVQRMLERGFLARTGFYVSLAHTDAVVDRYLDAVDGVFAGIARDLNDGNVLACLQGPVAHRGFRRLS